jgi:hypothetical protein
MCNNCLVHCIYFVYYVICIRKPCSGAAVRGLTGESLKNLRFSLAGNKESVHDQMCTYDIPVYYVVYRIA